MLRLFVAAALAAALSWSASARAADFTLPEPPPADWLAQADLFGRITALPAERDAEVVAWGQAHQSQLSSGYLFELSRRLLAVGQPEQALEWYAIALMRGQYDAGRCRDSSARRAVSGLARQAAVVARFGHQNPHLFGQAGTRALARDDLFTHTVSPDWICAQGLTGMGGQSAGTIPANLWPGIADTVRADFTRQFAAMIER
ncbi:MAG: hypothetical protein AB7G62_14860 [Magnetospirillum sp.]